MIKAQVILLAISLISIIGMIIFLCIKFIIYVIMKKVIFCVLTIFFITYLFCIPVFAYNLDTSVNSQIEKQYDSNKLNKDMNVQQNSVSSNNKPPKTTPVFDNSTPVVKKITNTVSNLTNTKSGIKLPSGTKFNVKSNIAVSGWSGVNSLLTFTSTESVYKSGVTIPSGTQFKGVITASHGGQMTGNGGLIKIKITNMILNGKSIPVEGKITKANSKNVFFNNIKGARQYLQGVDNKINQGISFYKKAKNLSSQMSSNPVGTVLSPLPLITGWLGSAICTVSSPVTGLTQKGKNISLPTGTIYEIKLIQDAYIN